MKIIWHGTASIEIVNEQGRVLFDPFVPLRHSDVPVTISEFDGFSDIFVTHGHLDHIVNIPEIIRRNPQTVIHCTQTPMETLTKKGVPEGSLRRLGYGEEIELNGFYITTFHGRHAILPLNDFSRLFGVLTSPARGNLPFLLRENRACQENDETVFYRIECGGSSISLMGSLNLRDDTEYPVGSDVLILPYNGWKDNFPMAVKVIDRLAPKRVLLDHYDVTFPPLTIPIDLSPVLGLEGAQVEAMELGKEYKI